MKLWIQFIEYGFFKRILKNKFAFINIYALITIALPIIICIYENYISTLPTIGTIYWR